MPRVVLVKQHQALALALAKSSVDRLLGSMTGTQKGCGVSGMPCHEASWARPAANLAVAVSSPLSQTVFSALLVKRQRDLGKAAVIERELIAGTAVAIGVQATDWMVSVGQTPHVGGIDDAVAHVHPLNLPDKQ